VLRYGFITLSWLSDANFILTVISVVSNTNVSTYLFTFRLYYMRKKKNTHTQKQRISDFI